MVTLQQIQSALLQNGVKPTQETIAALFKMPGKRSSIANWTESGIPDSRQGHAELILEKMNGKFGNFKSYADDLKTIKAKLTELSEMIQALEAKMNRTQSE